MQCVNPLVCIAADFGKRQRCQARQHLPARQLFTLSLHIRTLQQPSRLRVVRLPVPQKVSLMVVQTSSKQRRPLRMTIPLLTSMRWVGAHTGLYV